MLHNISLNVRKFLAIVQDPQAPYLLLCFSVLEGGCSIALRPTLWPPAFVPRFFCCIEFLSISVSTPFVGVNFADHLLKSGLDDNVR